MPHFALLGPQGLFLGRGGRKGKVKKQDHKVRNTFLGTVRGAALGNTIFPSLETLSGVLLDGFRGHEIRGGRVNIEGGKGEEIEEK